MMQEELITVIIPVYNVIKYLPKCIESVLSQSYRNLEIFLVDDGATDGCGAICDKYAELDSRVKVIHKKNGGLADARNAALDQMSGRYVTFVDSDDFIARDYVKYLYDLLIENRAEISICGIQNVLEDIKHDEMKTQQRDHNELENTHVTVYKSLEAMKCYLYQGEILASACAKLYCAEIFRGIRYPVGKYYEDMAVICQILESVEAIALGYQAYYYYLQRRDSIMGENFNPRKMDRIEIANMILSTTGEKTPELVRACKARCFLASIQTFREIPAREKYKDYQIIAWKEATKYRNDVLYDEEAKKSLRLMALLSFLGRRNYVFLGRCYTVYKRCFLR